MADQPSRGGLSTLLSSDRLHHEDVMAMPRVRSRLQRASLWLTAIITFAVGLGVYLKSSHRPAFMAPLSFRLVNMAPEHTGIHFVHQKGDFSPFFDNIRPWIQANSAAACVNDVDRDGLLDIYLVNAGSGTKNLLYRNMGDFQFAEIRIPSIEDLNPPGDGFSTDCVFADIDNDGYDDLLVMAMSHAPRLFLNVTDPSSSLGRTFVDVSQEANMPGYMNAFTATFMDVENDGDLDLFIAELFPSRYDPEIVPGSPYIHHMNVPDAPGAGRIFPNSMGHATNGGIKHLYLNDGHGVFVEQDTVAWGFMEDRRYTWDIGTADINRDGYTDLYYANDFGPDELYLNDGGKAFRHYVGVFPTDVGRDSSKGMDAEIADINNDGYPEIYVSNIFHPFLPEGNMLWMSFPEETEDPFKPRLKNVAAQIGLQDAGWGWGGKFIDLDLDGDVDMVATNGMISQNPDKNYWFALMRLAGGSGEIISDTTKLPPIHDMSLSGHEVSHVFVNDGHRFHDRAADTGVTRAFDGRGVIVADFDVDGRPDVVIVPQGEAPMVLRNEFVSDGGEAATPGTIGLRLAGDGRRVNRNATGSRIKISPADSDAEGVFKPQYFEISAANGYAAQSMYWVAAGLGTYEGPVDIEVWWTDGTIETISGLQPNQYHDIVYRMGAEVSEHASKTSENEVAAVAH